MEDVIAGKFKLGRKIGSGSFGELYLGVNVHSGDEVAVKLEGNKAGLLRFLLKPSLPSLSHRPTTQTVSPPSYPPLATVSLSFSSNNLTGKRNSWKIVLSWQSLGFESKPKLASDSMESEKGFSELKWNLYPDIEPDSSGFLKVSDIHTIYWGQSGNPDGHVFYGSFEEEQEKGRTSIRRSSQRVLR